MPLEIKRSLSPDGLIADIGFPNAAFRVNADELKSLIVQLAELRSVMLPQEPAAFVPPKSIQAVPDPGLTVEPDRWNDAVLVHLRDPGFGWLHYALSPPLAERLGRHLLSVAREPNTSAGRPN